VCRVKGFLSKIYGGFGAIKGIKVLISYLVGMPNAMKSSFQKKKKIMAELQRKNCIFPLITILHAMVIINLQIITKAWWRVRLSSTNACSLVLWFFFGLTLAFAMYIFILIPQELGRIENESVIPKLQTQLTRLCPINSFRTSFNFSIQTSNSKCKSEFNLNHNVNFYYARV